MNHNKAQKPIPDVVINRYAGLFETAFHDNDRQFSDVNEVILGKDTITFAFTRVRSEKSSSRIVVPVTNIDAAYTAWTLACEPIRA